MPVMASTFPRPPPLNSVLKQDKTPNAVDLSRESSNAVGSWTQCLAREVEQGVYQGRRSKKGRG